MKNIAFLSLGSNIGTRHLNLKSATNNINENKLTNVVNVSNMYESEAMYNLNQNKFYNMVVKIETSLNAYLISLSPGLSLRYYGSSFINFCSSNVLFSPPNLTPKS